MESLTIYKSSAGSGKTFTLVLEYLKLVIANPNSYGSILAITFTNAATNEMKKRIIERLMELAIDNNDRPEQNIVHEILSNYFKEHNIELPYPINHQARKALDNILNDYSNFSVSTIERFFQRIVRAFTRELNIPMGFEVEMQQAQVLEKVIGEMLLDVGKEKDLTRLLKQFLDYNLSEDKSWNVHWMLKSLGQQVFREQFQQLNVETPLDKTHIQTIQEIAAELIKTRRIFEQHLISLAEEAITILERVNLELEDFKFKTKGSVPSYFYKVRDKKEFEPTTRPRNGCENPDLWISPKSPKRASFEVALGAGIVDKLNQMIIYYDDHISDYQTAVSVSGSIYSFGVMYDLQQKLAQYRKEHNQLIISDTSFLLSIVLHGGTDPPFIYERVGSRYMHYLLDEFQDTSDMQWENLFPLLREAMSQGSNDGTPHNLIVGDVKQSIYRWRNGNMELLNHKVEQQILEAFGQRPVEKFLTDNWRTAGEVVEFNNNFFGLAVQRLGNTLCQEESSEIYQAYKNIEQNSKKKNIRGFTGVYFLEHESPIKNPMAISWKERAKEKTLEVIDELLNDGFRECDITLLIRRNSEGVQLAQYLQKHGVKVVSAESLLLMRNSKIIFIHSFLKSLVYEDDEVARTTLLYYLIQIQEKGNITHESFLETESIEILNQLFSDRAQLLRLPVYDCVSLFIHRFPWLHQPDSYVLSFLAAILEYTQLQDSSIIGFLEWWEDQKASRAIASTEEQDAVRIMTIHKSKGLEFPVVIMPFADWSLKPKSGEFIWVRKPEKEPYDQFEYLPVKLSSKLSHSYFDKEYSKESLSSYIDNLNLLYVAFTRPMHRLYLFTKDHQQEIKGITLISHLISHVIKNDLNLETKGELWFWGTKIPYVVPAHEADQDITELLPLDHFGKDHRPAISIRYSSNMYLPTDIRIRSQQIMAGELIHEALAFVSQVNDIKDAVNHTLHKGFISSGETAFLEELIQEVVLHPDAAHWFGGNWEVKNEAEILHEDGSILRPDRVMIQDGKAVVVDYKTGDPYPSHHIQVQKYMLALKNMGYDQVEGFVYYLLQHVERVSLQ